MHRTLAVLGVILVTVAMAGLAAAYGFTMVSTVDGYDDADREYAQLQCLGDIVFTEVPTDAVVFVAEQNGSGAGDSVQRMYWLQRITELTYPERVVTDDVTLADVVVRLVEGSDEPCDGIGIEVTQP